MESGVHVIYFGADPVIIERKNRAKGADKRSSYPSSTASRAAKTSRHDSLPLHRTNTTASWLQLICLATAAVRKDLRKNCRQQAAKGGAQRYE
jgi:hypothetical protein